MKPDIAPNAVMIEAAINLVVCSFLFGKRYTIMVLHRSAKSISNCTDRQEAWLTSMMATQGPHKSLAEHEAR